MRILFFSRRYFPAISGMSVYAQNLLGELVKLGHDVTMISQYRGDEAGTRVYGGGPPPPLSGVKIIGLEALGEQEPGFACWERDIETMIETGLREHAAKPFDIVHAQYGYPTGLAAIEFSRKTGIPNVVSIQGGDGHWVGPCCETHRLAMRAVLDHAGALLIGSRSFALEVEENHGVSTDGFKFVPGAVNCERFKRARRLVTERTSKPRRTGFSVSWSRRSSQRRARHARCAANFATQRATLSLARVGHRAGF